MPYDSRELSIDDALSTSQSVYEVQFPSWGIRTSPAGLTSINPNFQFPPPGARAVPTSLAGIALGPRSTVDRCWVTWDRQKIVAANATQGGKVQVESLPRPLTVDAPLMFPQGTRVGILPSTAAPPTTNNDPQMAMHLGLLYVFPKDQGSADQIIGPSLGAQTATTILPDTYVDSTGTTQILGTANPSNPLFLAPYLELYLYLQPPLFPPPTARAPLLVNYQYPCEPSPTPVCIAQIPIFGRRHVRVQVRNLTRVCSYQVGLLRAVRENSPLPLVTAPLFEAPAGSAAGVAAGTTATFDLDHPCADYLNLYADAGNVGGSQIPLIVAAYD
jgi:hypothetical protein